MRRTLFSAALTIIFAVGSEARAASLLPGTTVVPTTITGLPGYTLVTLETLDYGYTSPSTLIYLTGQVKSGVYRENTSGKLAFTYEILPQTQSNTLDRAYSRGGYKPSIVTDVSVIPYLGHFSAPPKTAFRTADGNDVGFNYGGLRAYDKPGVLVVKTDATTYARSDFVIETTLDVGTGSAYGAGVSAFAPTPEPASLALAISALPAAIVAWRRRKHQAAHRS